MKNSLFFLTLLLCATIMQGYCKSNEFDQRVTAACLLRIRFISSKAMMATLRNSESMLNQVIGCFRDKRNIIELHDNLLSIVFNNTSEETATAFTQLLLQHDESIQKIAIKKWGLPCKKR